MDQDYMQARNKKSILKFMRNFFGSPIKKLSSVADVEDYLQEEEGSVVAFFDKENKDIKETYRKVAKDLREIGEQFFPCVTFFESPTVLKPLFCYLGLYFGYATNSSTRVQYQQWDNQVSRGLAQSK